MSYIKAKVKYGQSHIFIQGVEYSPSEINQYDFEESRGNYESHEPQGNFTVNFEEQAEFERPLDSLESSPSEAREFPKNMEELKRKWYMALRRAIE